MVRTLVSVAVSAFSALIGGGIIAVLGTWVLIMGMDDIVTPGGTELLFKSLYFTLILVSIPITWFLSWGGLNS